MILCTCFGCPIANGRCEMGDIIVTVNDAIIQKAAASERWYKLGRFEQEYIRYSPYKNKRSSTGNGYQCRLHLCFECLDLAKAFFCH